MATSVWMQILDAMNQDSGIPLTQLQVDGGMTSNKLLMQLQADILCIPVGEFSSLATLLADKLIRNPHRVKKKGLNWLLLTTSGSEILDVKKW